ncbi:unnamed protein product [Gongylonema pulchrum]|uniref:J domain-containing protein n=1 Tax=Gongylonema pulchrum TaxID=637853 RepID=A0A183E3J2_9BILA|nr:unnamed protein product [Gongylonema pulchrum]
MFSSSSGSRICVQMRRTGAGNFGTALLMRTCYDVLGCSPNASLDELKEGYLRELRAKHPDRGGSSAALLLVRKAWFILR